MRAAGHRVARLVAQQLAPKKARWIGILALEAVVVQKLEHALLAEPGTRGAHGEIGWAPCSFFQWVLWDSCNRIMQGMRQVTILSSFLKLQRTSGKAKQLTEQIDSRET